jgi:hypothetical protein
MRGARVEKDEQTHHDECSYQRQGRRPKKEARPSKKTVKTESAAAGRLAERKSSKVLKMLGHINGDPCRDHEGHRLAGPQLSADSSTEP